MDKAKDKAGTDVSTAIIRAKAHLAQQTTMGERKYSWHSRISTKSSKAKRLLTSGTAGHDERAFGKAKIQLAPRYFDSDQPNESTSGTEGHDGRVLAS